MNPERFREMVSGVLIVGVAVSAVFIALGFMAALAVGWQGSLLGAAQATTVTTDLATLEPAAIAQLGLVTLLATPVARVAASVVGFALEGDRLYAAITTAVLLILLISILVLR